MTVKEEDYMKREDLLAKGLTEEQVTEILNMHHNESQEVSKENERLKGEIANANEKLAGYSNMEKEYNAYKQSQMTEQEKYEAMKKETEKNYAMSKRVYNEAEAKTILAQLGGEIDENVLNSIVSDDKEKTIANANALVNLIKARQEESIKKTKEEIQNLNILPTPSNVPSGEKAIKTFDDFDALSYDEQVKFAKEHPDEFNNL
jgi:hypothetical protein